MTFKPGDSVERLLGAGENRYGVIQRRTADGHDSWYVTVGIGLTHIDQGRDLRLVDDEDAFKPDPSTIS